MTTFGLSAFLKLACLNDRQQRSEIRRRIQSVPGAYDFHRNMRLRGRDLVVGGERLDDVLEVASNIVKPAERKSTTSAIRRLAAWRQANPGAVLQFPPVIYESPASIFRVKFAPDFGVRLGDVSTAVHLWNTLTPALDPRLVGAALSLFPQHYDGAVSIPDDLAVLSLQDMRVYRLSAAPDLSDLGHALVERIEELFLDVRSELGTGRGDRPPAPPPA